MMVAIHSREMARLFGLKVSVRTGEQTVEKPAANRYGKEMTNCTES